MTYNEITEQIRLKGSFLCIGLDTEITKVPDHLLGDNDPVFAFNRQIIDATIDLAVAYKPNLAFYETLGPKGLISLEKTLEHIRSRSRNIFAIADAKRGDIGNTSAQYAKAFFEHFDFDAITVAPYMGEDSVSPFLTYKNKWIILLALTSNKGAKDFQMLETISRQKFFEEVLFRSRQWGSKENMMYVVGATQAEMFADIREIVPDHFLLVPGVGAQGGSLEDVAKFGLNENCGLIVNSSRNIIYASSGKDFAVKAREQALVLQSQMKAILKENKII
jgi:orotidine-5'-phosphate decarboxylase